MLSVAAWSGGSVLEWRKEFLGLTERLAPVFGWTELRRMVRCFVEGLLSGATSRPG